MTSLVARVVSFRLGGTDGVSVEALKWERALRALGFDVRRVAGELLDGARPGDAALSWLAIDPPASASPSKRALEDAVVDADLVVVENTCSLPLNPHAARTVARVVERAGVPVVLHHHDLPWQRAATAHVTDLPPDAPHVVHVTINARSRDELLTRGFAPARVVHVPNCFDVDAEPGARDATRDALGFGPDDLVVLQPTRAIERKNVPGGLSFATALQRELPDRHVRYWLTGPAEDGYGPTLDALVRGAAVPVTIGRVGDVADAYAAADVVVFPSTWEGFGNPLVEATIARRLVVAGPYPVRDELAAIGLAAPSLDDVDTVVRRLRAPADPTGARNLEAVRRHLSLAMLPDRLADVLARAVVPEERTA
ncbi:MAG TPA: glycosyltransferase [Segeticoccus sp.]|uniref:glycosyltransferase n=1 Tax=Segeticoccus sp. TaxID=2706531 RepID=UPI002D7EEC00|nr:glycosyltransferase [Segeticoccus sp.]HET8601160.1 glycosyltransferase [Segeticoccus sp.]